MVHQQPDALNGDVVVAGIGEGEATVKTFSRKGDKVVLTPANEAYEPMTFDGSAGDVTIFGKVVTVVRSLELIGVSGRFSPRHPEDPRDLARGRSGNLLTQGANARIDEEESPWRCRPT